MRRIPYIQALTEEDYFQSTPIQDLEFLPVEKLYNFKEVRNQIMAEAYLRGFNPKEIAGYFKVGHDIVYRSINIRELKKQRIRMAYKKLMEKDKLCAITQKYI
jgi:hypothetical protein